MDAEALALSPGPKAPRVVVLRAVADARAVVAMLRAGRPLLLVFRSSGAERTRLLDLLTGWALGSGGDLDRIGPNTLVAQPPGAAPMHLSRPGIVSAVAEIFGSDPERPLSRDEEELLLPQAAAGSVHARRRLTDAYAEIATLVALWLKPRVVSETRAVAVAHEELDRLVARPPRDGVLLVALVDRIWSKLSS